MPHLQAVCRCGAPGAIPGLSAEDLAQRLQKRNWQTRANRDRLEALITQMVDYVRRSNLYNRLRRIDALEKSSAEIAKVHDLSSRATRQRLEEIFYLLRLARQGR